MPFSKENVAKILETKDGEIVKQFFENNKYFIVIFYTVFLYLNNKLRYNNPNIL